MKEITLVGDAVELAITSFVEAVELSSNLMIKGTAIVDDKECFIIEDLSRRQGEDGVFHEVDIEEVISVIDEPHKAGQFIDCMNRNRNPIMLHGVTRIVGYYSRVTNWNKSKVGELRDRHQSNYALSGQVPKFDDDRMTTINNM